MKFLKLRYLKKGEAVRGSDLYLSFDGKLSSAEGDVGTRSRFGPRKLGTSKFFSGYVRPTWKTK